MDDLPRGLQQVGRAAAPVAPAPAETAPTADARVNAPGAEVRCGNMALPLQRD